MTRKVRLLLIGSGVMASIAIAAAPKTAPKPQSHAQQKVTGPVANYWVSAATSSGLGLGGLGSGSRPSMREMMRIMRGGSGPPQHLLTLQLGSTRTAPDPEADHLPGTLAALPLVTPKIVSAAPTTEETVEDQPTMTERPRGRILLYWGCGEHAAPGQPYVIDFSKMLAGQAMPRLPFVTVHHQNPPSQGRYATYGEWPNSRTRNAPPQTLIGAHRVHGNYTPDIAFTLPPTRDYMPPLLLDTTGKTASGGTLLAWQPVTGATGYFATLVGASATSRDEATIIMWSSSAVSTFAGGGLTDYLAPAEVRRLIAQKSVMPPSQTRCAVPAEVGAAAPMGLLSMIAYGEEADFADPPRPADPRTPWDVNWTVKVRYKSTAGAFLGMPARGAMQPSSEQSGDAAPADQPRKKRGGLLGKLKDAAEAAGAVPH